MNYIQTPNRSDYTRYNALDDKKGMHHQTGAVCREYFENGLTKKYDAGSYNNDLDWGWYPLKGYNAGNLGSREFSSDNQEVLHTYFMDFLDKTQKEKITIVEIGVNRNAYENTSTSVFLNNKRDQDIYLGIDIDDKTFLDNPEKNIHTIQCPSQNINMIYDKMVDCGIDQIDVLMIDGWHSINQCYLEWELYTQFLASGGMVVMHDTNFHPGPYYLVDSIDTNKYDVYKHLWDIQDWGISVAIKKNM